MDSKNVSVQKDMTLHGIWQTCYEKLFNSLSKSYSGCFHTLNHLTGTYNAFLKKLVLRQVKIQIKHVNGATTQDIRFS